MNPIALGYYVHSATSEATAPILLFLHGVAECFRNTLNLEQIGPKNLFEQGIPKRVVDLLPAHPDHPLRTFLLIAPQLPDRETPWIAILDKLKEILAHHGSEKRKLYIVGFSKGGLGAFQVGHHLGARAMVTIDASPMDDNVHAVFHQWFKQPPPFWAIHTTYPPGVKLRRVQDFNELLTQQTHSDIKTPPAPQTQTRTCLDAPEGTEGVARHVWICDEATKSTAPYHWLLQHG